MIIIILSNGKVKQKKLSKSIDSFAIEISQILRLNHTNIISLRMGGKEVSVPANATKSVSY